MQQRLSPDDLAVGSEIAGPLRMMTAERIEWYGTAMLSAAAGRFTRVGANIHTDEEYARSEGLPDVIADGMVTTNWISSMLVARFGMDYLERGELRTKFVKPVFTGTTVSVRGRVRSLERSQSGGRILTLVVWCEDENGVKLTDGEAMVEVTT